MKRKNLIVFSIISFLINSFLFSATFNEKLSNDEKAKLNSGEILIRNIDFYKNICLDMSENAETQKVKQAFNDLSPKYLAEVIQFKPYKGNEDLDKRLEEVLYNVSDYAGIPYWSEQKQKYYDLYDSAKIVDSKTDGNKTILQCILQMKPFGQVDEEIVIEKSNNSIIYMATNQNKLRYLDKFDCVWPKKMKICIYLFRDGENWVLYGIGGVNAPRIPFFTERIEVSFINRIKTFCNYIFKKF